MSIKMPFKPRPIGARRKATASSLPFHQTAPVTNGYVKSFDGTKLFYSMEGQGKPLIFCYGLVCSSLHWTYQIDHFKNAHRAIWFDYRGHQNSEVPKDLKSLTLENLALDLKAILDELNVQDAVFLGHSMGVNVVLEFYRKYPERVVGMVLANGTAQRPLETLFEHNFLQAGFQVFKKVHQLSPAWVSILWKAQKDNPVARFLATLGGFNPHLTPPGDIELYMRQVAEMDPSILIQLIENYDTYNASTWLHTVEKPTLIVAGEQDKLVPLSQQELMHQLMPHSQLEIIAHGSHCPQMDLPDLVNFHIEKFLTCLNYR